MLSMGLAVARMRNCFCAPARNQRWAAEGELVVPLPKHSGILPERGPGCQEPIPRFALNGLELEAFREAPDVTPS